MNNITSLVLATAIALAGCSSDGAGSPSQSAKAGAASPKRDVTDAALVLDVRTPEEFASGHLDRAENIPVDEVEAQVDAIASKVGGDKTKPIAVYCASGARSARAKAMLEKAGFTKVTNAGGYKELKD